MKASVWMVTALLLTGQGLWACSSSKQKDIPAEAGPSSGTAGVGEICKLSRECRQGLSCISGSCTPGNNAIHGAACVLSAECSDGDYCTQEGKCDTTGTKARGSVCSTDGDCAHGLVCALVGLTGLCAEPGQGDLGKPCVQMNECMAGLLCATGVCTKESLLPRWEGATCESREEIIPKVYFRIPRHADPAIDTDFYRLPFPNDIRRKDGKISLAGHPLPGPRIFPFDLVERYIQAIEAEPMGFGTNQTVYFRFSRSFDPNSLYGPGVLTFVDITSKSMNYGDHQVFTWGFDISRTTYLCSPYLWARPQAGRPLLPNVTYAVLIAKSITDTVGTPFIPDEDFTTMLAETAPSDAELLHAYKAYAPLRAYLAEKKVQPSDLLAAAVFTVDAYEDPWSTLASAVNSMTSVTVETLIRCGDPKAISPCDDGLTGAKHTRGCPEKTSATFDEYQGTVALPVFQKGTAPYLTPSEDGRIRITGRVATPERWESVCFALAIPKVEKPSKGFPLVVHAHGTGGNYRSFITSGLAEDFAIGGLDIGLPADAGIAGPATQPMAMLGLDGILHGSRKGSSNRDEGELVYNFLNPGAARDNVLQAAVDLLAIPSSLTSLGARGLYLDRTRLALYGHSLGGNAATLVAAHQSPYGAFVFSGTGGTLLFTLLKKTSPFNLPAHLPYLLGESNSKAMDGSHPVLNLMQMYFDRSDSVNFARRILSLPVTGMTVRHVMHVMGTNDTYSVLEAQRSYALAANLPVAKPVIDNYGLSPVDPPLRNNDYFGYYGNLTAGQVQYQPAAGHDGHFVATENLEARRAIQNFLGSYMRDGIPTIVP